MPKLTNFHQRCPSTSTRPTSPGWTWPITKTFSSRVLKECPAESSCDEGRNHKLSVTTRSRSHEETSANSNILYTFWISKTLCEAWRLQSKTFKKRAPPTTLLTMSDPTNQSSPQKSTSRVLDVDHLEGSRMFLLMGDGTHSANVISTTSAPTPLTAARLQTQSLFFFLLDIERAPT